MSPLGLFWDSAERRPRFLVRVVILAGGGLALALIPILFVSDPLTRAHRAGRFLAGLSSRDYDRAINLIAAPLMSASILVAIFLTARFVDRRPLADLGVRGGSRGVRDAAAGFLIGGAIMLFVFLVELAFGWIRVIGGCGALEIGATVPLAFAFVAVKNVCVGVTEEALCRGYLIPNLTETLGFTRWSKRVILGVAIVISSVLFSAHHIVNPNFSLGSFVGLTVNGVLLALGFVLTGSLALPIALHFAWNFFQGSVFAFPVSGDREAASLLITSLGGPDLPTGGPFGPEAGLVGIAASLIGIILVFAYTQKWRRARASDVG